ncbi:hypothetical protein XccvBFoX7_gp62c [Xanthomonas phage FoX7]|uniref:Uncharacterized protein n=2 Tax=Carpasinavirus XcP1 TaxID=2182344 RepID=A0A858NPB7_9CAUD|nr:hypothetical protein XccvBFoX6_gp62c [Xanthomonas phage FoX6]QJB22219.1 hypothetical protein XccvBFoX7_gp62c [Xanthomonas phage FoX7]
MNADDIWLFKEAVKYFEFNADTHTSGCAERQAKIAKMKDAIKRFESRQQDCAQGEMKIVGHLYRVVGSEDEMSRDWSTPGVIFSPAPAVEEGLCTLPDMRSGGIQSMNIYAKVAK